MLSEKVFQIAFLISLIAHGVILFQNANLDIFPRKKTEDKLEVSYIKAPEKPKAEKTSSSKEKLFLKLPSKLSSKKTIPPPFVDKENIFNKERKDKVSESTFTKPILIKPDIIAIKKKITLPPIDIDKVNNPSYISYYQIVREKIKRAAYQNYTRTETGEVYLSFIISGDGYLKEVRLIPNKSSSNSYLRDIALRSLKDASPFPIFPKELDYPQLSFNVVISFEIE